ncbi:thioesterase II family protein [Streptomyces sp. NBC_01012]|uniref:thioesterase II family protein n=1 Tax=Streptomyces sp. NBC_01012 TaxID=2903717 RepID=UPI003864ACBB
MTNSMEKLWGRSYHPAPERPRQLVCFPHAGGSASFFHPVSAQLSSVAEVLSVQYPGRQDRRAESSPTDIRVMAEQAYGALRDRLRSRPTTFFGHSMGALVAFEVARLLEADGGELTHLFVSARRAPSRHREENVHRRDDDGIIAELKLLAGTDSALLSDEELLRMILPAIRSDYAAVETYRCASGVTVSAPITALVGDRDPAVTTEEVQSWSGHTTGAFDLRVYPGGHFYLSEQAPAVLALLGQHFVATHEPVPK